MGCFDHNQYVELTMHFECNLKCEHCMIEGTMDRLEPESMAKFKELLAYNRRSGRWKGIIFTGSEVTLNRDLTTWSQMARESGFQHVRIQTHGMHLANPKYCQQLVSAGIDEYFVSVTAADAATHDAITAIPGSFERTLRGLDNLDAFDGVTVLTNTVITRRSYRQLAEVVERLRHLRRLAQMDFWNFWPMKENDERDLIVSHEDVLPFLRQAILAARAAGRAVEVKNYPECLLSDLRDALNNDQPKLFIDPAFWTEFMRNGFAQCIHRDRCGSRKCLGLNTAYVRKLGWQPELLIPLPLVAPAHRPVSEIEGRTRVAVAGSPRVVPLKTIGR